MAKMRVIMELEPKEVNALLYLIHNTDELIDDFEKEFQPPNNTPKANMFQWSESQFINLQNLKSVTDQLEKLK